ncbi:MAG TPA: aspartyl/asparaginyl beta-hydroxylase domain-containing protein [Steroidobacteraceae bacterium]|jgi:aspartyl/asparaginyl beta-hydroxylase (cupin superfamily)
MSGIGTARSSSATSATNDERIRQLIDAAAQSFANGRADEAARFLRQAESEAPRHPLVLNEIARRMLLGNNPSVACDLLKEAIKNEPRDPSMWINLAAALRGLNHPDEELAAIDKALELEPANIRALMQKASLQELQGKPRAAAATYRTMLQLIPPSAEVPPSMQPILAHAKQAVETNNHALETFLEERLTDLRTRHSDVSLGRFDRCLATLVQKQRVYRPQPSFMYFPYLPAIEFHERGEFPWLDAIEAATDDIRAELVNVLSDGDSVLEPYVTREQKGPSQQQWRELQHSRRWGVYYLWREGVAHPEHIERCPRTVAALQNWPRCDIPGCAPTAVFSILDAKTHIPPHTGINNTRLLVHLPLIVPPGCGFRVGAEKREWHPGKAFIFDDTIEHEAWNDSDEPRAVLILDIWNPAVTEAERDMVRSTIAGVNEYYGFSQHQGV